MTESVPSSGNSTAACSQSQTVKTTLRLFKGGWLMCWEMASTCPSCTPSPVCVCVCGRLDARAHILYPYMCSLPFVRVCVSGVYFCMSIVCIFHRRLVWHCVCVCVHCADWAGVLAIRKTTSGKVHINHVPQLKERNGAEMGRGREGGGERIMRDGVWGIQSRSVALFALTWCWKHLWIGKVTTMGPNPLGRENQRLI